MSILWGAVMELEQSVTAVPRDMDAQLDKRMWIKIPIRGNDQLRSEYFHIKPSSGETMRQLHKRLATEIREAQKTGAMELHGIDLATLRRIDESLLPALLERLDAS